MVRISDDGHEAPDPADPLGRSRGDEADAEQPEAIPVDTRRANEADDVGAFLLGALGGAPLDEEAEEDQSPLAQSLPAEERDAEPPARHRTEADTVWFPRPPDLEPEEPAEGGGPAPEPGPPPEAPPEATDLDDLLAEISQLSSPRRAPAPEPVGRPAPPARVERPHIAFETDRGPTLPHAAREAGEELDLTLISFERDPAGTIDFGLGDDLFAALVEKLDSVEPREIAGRHELGPARRAAAAAAPGAAWESVLDVALGGPEADAPADVARSLEGAAGSFGEDELRPEDMAALEDALNSITFVPEETPEPEPVVTAPPETAPAATEAPAAPAEEEPLVPATDPGAPLDEARARMPEAPASWAEAPAEEEPAAGGAPLTAAEIAELEDAFAAFGPADAPADAPAEPGTAATEIVDAHAPHAPHAPLPPLAPPAATVVAAEAEEAEEAESRMWATPTARFEEPEIEPIGAPGGLAGEEPHPKGPEAKTRAWPGMGKITSPVLAGFAAAAAQEESPEGAWRGLSAGADEALAISLPARIALWARRAGRALRTGGLPLPNLAVIAAYAILLVASGHSAGIVIGMMMIGGVFSVAFSMTGINWRWLMLALSGPILAGVVGDAIRRHEEIIRMITGG